MREAEVDLIAETLNQTVLEVSTMAGGFSHETCLLNTADGQVVARIGETDSVVEAAVMDAARRHVPVPRVLRLLPRSHDTRPAMLLEYVPGTPLSQVLDTRRFAVASLRELGAEVGRVVAAIGNVRFDRPGFFADRDLTPQPAPPWSQQLPDFAQQCMSAAPPQRIDDATRQRWSKLCAAHAPALAAIDDQVRLAHADINPKNILVTPIPDGWRVDAILDWEFSFSGCPYGDAANMARFGEQYPEGFLAGFNAGFTAHRPADLPLDRDWAYLGRVLDMFALSDLVTRPPGHPVAEQAAQLIHNWVTEGMP